VVLGAMGRKYTEQGAHWKSEEIGGGEKKKVGGGEGVRVRRFCRDDAVVKRAKEKEGLKRNHERGNARKGNERGRLHVGSELPLTAKAASDMVGEQTLLSRCG